MSKSNAIFAGLAAGLVAALFAYGGEASIFGWIKSLVVGSFSASIVYVLWLQLDQIVHAGETMGRLEAEFEKREPNLPELYPFELLVNGRGALPAGEAAAQLLSEPFRAIEFARIYPKLAVNLGVVGSLAGMAIASLGMGIHNGASPSLSTLVEWSAGSLICAVFGIGSSTFLSLKLALIDTRRATLVGLAAAHAHGVLQPVIDTEEERLSRIISKTVAECFLQVGDIWESFRLTAKTIESGATSMDQAATSVLDAGKMLTEQMEVSNRITWQLNSISEKITETGQSVAEAGRFLQDSSRELIPMYRSIQTGVEGLDRSLGSLYPALESARDLQLTIKAADLVFRNIDNQVSGMASSMHDEIRSASDRMVSNQQKVLLEGIAPPLTTIGRTMDLLLLLIDRTEQLLRNLPIAVPAKRIVDDLQAAGVAHLAAAERDAKSVADVSERLASTESRMDEVLNELKAAHSQIATSLKELEIETADLARNVGEVSSHIDGPFWKKLGGRKP